VLTEIALIGLTFEAATVFGVALVDLLADELELEDEEPLHPARRRAGRATPTLRSRRGIRRTR